MEHFSDNTLLEHHSPVNAHGGSQNYELEIIFSLVVIILYLFFAQFLDIKKVSYPMNLKMFVFYRSRSFMNPAQPFY